MVTEPSDPYFPSIGKAAEQAGLLPNDDSDIQADESIVDQDRPIEEVESLCMSCGQQGITRMLLTSIPYFREIIVLSFQCEHCGFSNNEVQPAGSYKEQGTVNTVKVLHRDDLNRQLVKSNTCTVTIPEFELTIPASKGQLTTIEGILRDTVTDLSAEQPLRRIQDEHAYNKIQGLVDSLADIIADTDSKTESLSDSIREEPGKGQHEKPIRAFTITLDDPTGNSFLEFRDSAADPQWTLKRYSRTKQQNIELGITAPDDDSELFTGHHEPSDVPDNDEVFTFAGSCSSCGRPSDTRMKKVNIPYFKEVIIMSTNCPLCGYKDNEVKSGGAIAPQGKRIILKVEDQEDLTRDILKSETCGFEIPEINLVLHSGTLGGRFTTLEGLLQQIYDELSSKVIIGDSADGGESDKEKFTKFLSDLKSVMSVERRFTIILDDPLSNSYLQNIYAPDEDPNMTVEAYSRTLEHNEDLGLNDIKVENYEEPHAGQTVNQVE
ncbi:zf-ZPR1-domain-containing protein [Cantharellus anzutake]|uniref:zf-ZPR1-domain-containing protein n=1 Tax=Cantharellus anzutake TaxID=1750568 RepID=UPI00190389A2|nr:zf-ZPR1-domain-containing protein [Cantharellus anzutake]KAF8327180.1 zf-ZPR1-domain-containing protein [Cantharellus anzutake]